MIDYVNRRPETSTLLTIEDPIEFVHKQQVLPGQPARDRVSDTHGFKNSLKRASSVEDPDVILVGEMRDMETIEAALTLAETGHLTFGTLHTSDCVQSDQPCRRRVPRTTSSSRSARCSPSCSRRCSCQQLLPTHRRPWAARSALEIMVATSGMQVALIRDDKAHQIYSIIQTGGKLGMQTMNQCLGDLVRQNLITYEQAEQRSSDTEDLRRTIARG